MGSELPTLHVGLPAFADDRLVEIRIDHSWSVDSIGLDDFEWLGEQGGHCAGEAGGIESQGRLIFEH